MSCSCTKSVGSSAAFQRSLCSSYCSAVSSGVSFCCFAHNPCLVAFPRDCALPSGVFGPPPRLFPSAISPATLAASRHRPHRPVRPNSLQSQAQQNSPPAVIRPPCSPARLPPPSSFRNIARLASAILAFPFESAPPDRTRLVCPRSPLSCTPSNSPKS